MDSFALKNESMKRKNVMIDLMRRSLKSDLTCRDGEVADYRGVAWLEPDSGSPDPENPDVRDPAGEGGAEVCVMSMQPEWDVQLPPGSRLLTLHYPDSGSGKCHIMALQSNGALCWRPADGESATRNIAMWPSRLGSLRGACPYGRLVVLAGSEGMGWLLYAGDEGEYVFLDSLPEAPAISVSADSCTLEGYVRVAGNLPEINVDVNLDGLPCTAEGIGGWLTSADSGGVEAAVRERVYEAVAAGIDLYMSEARGAGMWLVPCRVGAAFGTALPGMPIDSGVTYTPPYARVASWALRGQTLSLGLEFSLRPVSLRVSYAFTAKQREWSPVFQQLSVYVSAEPEWRTAADRQGAPVTRVTSLTRLSASASAATGVAFRMASCSSSEMSARVAASPDMRLSVQAPVQGVTGGTVTLRRPAASAEVWTPDYRDFLAVGSDGVALTDEGVAVRSGAVLLTPMKENGVVYRHRDRIADSRILAVTQATLRKGVGADARHALYVFCADGIRQATADGRGGYHNARLVSRRVVAVAGGQSRFAGMPVAAESESGIWFVADGRLCHLALSGSISAWGSVTDAETPGNVEGAPMRLLYDGLSASLILITSQGEWRVYDTVGKSWHEVADPPLSAEAVMLPHAGRLYAMGADGAVCLLKVSMMAAYGDDGTDGDTAGIAPPPGVSLVRTRPLKLGDPFRRKRICGVAVAAAARLRVEGSDDLKEWVCVADGDSPLRALHPAAFRFHRITVTADEGDTDMLHTLGIGYRI